MPLVFTPLFTDSFTPSANPLNPSNWQTVIGNQNLAAVSGVCEIDPTAFFPQEGQANYIGSPIPDDQYVQLTATSLVNDGEGTIGINLRTDINEGIGYELFIAGNGDGTWTLGVGSIVTGTPIYSNSDFPFSLGDTFLLAIQGTTIYAYQNGVLFASGVDSVSPTPSGLPGIFEFATAVHDTQISNFITGSVTSGSSAYSVPDCRDYGNFPNDSVDVNGTLTYTVPSVDSRAAGAPVDSRTAGAPVACGTYPQNSRTPGVYGPGE